MQVKEIINGCLCCVLVGQLGNAIEELVRTQAPDRIIIETSGSAYPAPLAWELRKYEPLITLDGIVTVGASLELARSLFPSAAAGDAACVLRWRPTCHQCILSLASKRLRALVDL